MLGGLLLLAAWGSLVAGVSIVACGESIVSEGSYVAENGGDQSLLGVIYC